MTLLFPRKVSDHSVDPMIDHSNAISQQADERTAIPLRRFTERVFENLFPRRYLLSSPLMFDVTRVAA